MHRAFLTSLTYFFAVLTVCGQKIKEHQIYWSEDKKLKWEDFAVNYQKADFSHKTFMFAYPDRDKDKSEVGIYTVFHKKYSWVSPNYLNEPEQLIYFQVRFNILELHSRKVRKRAREIIQDETEKHKWKEIKKAFNNTIEMGLEEIKLFEERSNDGQDLNVVKVKAEEVKSRLNELREFSSSTIPWQ